MRLGHTHTHRGVTHGPDDDNANTLHEEPPHPHAGKRRQRLTAAEVLLVLSKQAPPLTQELLVLLHLGADVREPRPLLLLA